MKQCYECLKVKPLDDFYRTKRLHDGRHIICKECTKKHKKQYRQENKEKIALAQHIYRRSPKGRASKKQSNRAFVDKYPERIKVHSAVNNAIRSGSREIPGIKIYQEEGIRV